MKLIDPSVLVVSKVIDIELESHGLTSESISHQQVEMISSYKWVRVGSYAPYVPYEDLHMTTQ